MIVAKKSITVRSALLQKIEASGISTIRLSILSVTPMLKPNPGITEVAVLNFRVPSGATNGDFDHFCTSCNVAYPLARSIFLGLHILVDHIKHAALGKEFRLGLRPAPEIFDGDQFHIQIKRSPYAARISGLLGR